MAAEVDPSGTVTAKRKYDVYGLVRSGDAGTSAHKFVGQLGHPSEAESGLVYMRARYMDPAIGRFTSEDPKQDGLNWYLYTDNNPVNAVDVTGEFFWIIVFCIIMIALGVFCAKTKDFNSHDWHNFWAKVTDMADGDIAVGKGLWMPLGMFGAFCRLASRSGLPGLILSVVCAELWVIGEIMGAIGNYGMSVTARE